MLKIMPLGDSNTRGEGDDKAGYRDDLSSLLSIEGFEFDFVGSRTNGPASFTDQQHEGHGGWTIDDIVNGRDSRPNEGSVDIWLNTYQPDIILLMIGTNDIKRNNSEETAPDRLASLIDEHIFKLLPDVTLLVGSILPLTTNAQDSQEVLEYNATIPDIVSDRAAQGKDIHFVNIFSSITTNDLLPDDTHPTPEGFAKMANTWYAAIQAATAGRMTFGSTLFSADEESGVAFIDITRTRGERSASVVLNFNGGTASTLDYKSTPTIVNFGAGEISKTVAIPIINDDLVESTETVNLSLSSPTNGASIGTTNTAVLSILDTDVLKPDNDNELVNLEQDNKLVGTIGDDILQGKGGKDVLIGGKGDDKLSGGDGDDKLFGRNGKDRLNGNNGDDLLRGNGQNDILVGGWGDDSLFGGNGNDKLKGGRGDNLFDGGKGRDLVIAGRDRDTITLRKENTFDVVKNFDHRKDSFTLSRGLSFSRLDIFQDRKNTLIYSGQNLVAKLQRVEAETLDKNSFT